MEHLQRQLEGIVIAAKHRKGPALEDCIQLRQSILQELAKEAADYNIVWGLEVVNRYITNILNTAQQVCQRQHCCWHQV